MPILSRAIRNARAMMRAAEFGDSSIPLNSQVGFRTAAGGVTGEAAALAIGAVLSCVKALSDDTIVSPFRAYEGDPMGAHEPIKVQPQIVAAPFGDDLSPAAGLAQIVVSKAMRGNSYCFVLATDRRGLPTRLAVLHPDTITPRWSPEKGKYFQVGQEFYGPREIIHVTGLMLPGSVKGVDVLTYQRTTHDLAWKVNEYADNFFGNGGSPSGVLSVPGPGDRKKAREVAEMWDTSHAGVGNAHKPAIMFGGATWQQLTVTPENAQFLATRQFLREEICGLYGVPLGRINATSEMHSGRGAEKPNDVEAGYVRHGLMPTHAPIEQVWNRLIPGDQKTWTAFDYDEFLRADPATRASIAQIHRVIALRTPDEIRAKDYGLGPLPGGAGSDPHTPLNSNTASPAGGASNTPDAAPSGGTVGGGEK